VVGAFSRKIDELVERSHGKIQADAAHGKLVGLGYQGSSRTTRRVSLSPSGGGAASTAVGRGRGSRSLAAAM
jgi:hypothetical protein